MAPSVLKSISKAFKGTSGSTSSRDEVQRLPVNIERLNVSNTSASLAGPASPDSLHVASLHPDAHDDGGLACNNDELLRQQREAITQWIKSMGKRLMTGNINLISTPFPVVMFEPRSYLEKLADVWIYPRFLSQAAATSAPLERMQLVVAWFIAGLHHGFDKWMKPFNPILGETWQATLSDGTSMFIEQISHHPPVSAFHLEGPGGTYRFRGLSQPNVALMIKHYGFKTVAKGFRYVEFKDGSRIEIVYPSYYIKGVVYSSRPRAEVDGSAVFIDKKHNLKAVLRFGAVKGSRVPVLKRSDAVVGEIYDISSEQGSGQATSLAQARASTASSEEAAAVEDPDSESFESASETEWELRDYQDEQPSSSQHGQLQPGGQVSPQGPGESLAAALARGRGEVGSSGGGSAAITAAERPPSLPQQSHQQPATSPTAAQSSKRESQSNSLFSGFSKMIAATASMGLGTSSSTAEDDAEVVNAVVLSNIEGSWLSHLNIDGRRVWTLATEKPDVWTPAADALPSDSRFRKDLAVLKQGDVKGAQHWKEVLENAQRRDKKLREGQS